MQRVHAAVCCVACVSVRASARRWLRLQQRRCWSADVRNTQQPALRCNGSCSWRHAAQARPAPAPAQPAAHLQRHQHRFLPAHEALADPHLPVRHLRPQRSGGTGAQRSDPGAEHPPQGAACQSIEQQGTDPASQEAALMPCWGRVTQPPQRTRTRPSVQRVSLTGSSRAAHLWRRRVVCLLLLGWRLHFGDDLAHGGDDVCRAGSGGACRCAAVMQESAGRPR